MAVFVLFWESFLAPGLMVGAQGGKSKIIKKALVLSVGWLVSSGRGEGKALEKDAYPAQDLSKVIRRSQLPGQKRSQGASKTTFLRLLQLAQVNMHTSLKPGRGTPVKIRTFHKPASGTQVKMNTFRKPLLLVSRNATPGIKQKCY